MFSPREAALRAAARVAQQWPATDASGGNLVSPSRHERRGAGGGGMVSPPSEARRPPAVQADESMRADRHSVATVSPMRRSVHFHESVNRSEGDVVDAQRRPADHLATNALRLASSQMPRTISPPRAAVTTPYVPAAASRPATAADATVLMASTRNTVSPPRPVESPTRDVSRGVGGVSLATERAARQPVWEPASEEQPHADPPGASRIETSTTTDASREPHTPWTRPERTEVLPSPPPADEVNRHIQPALMDVYAAVCNAQRHVSPEARRVAAQHGDLGRLGVEVQAFLLFVRLLALRVPVQDVWWTVVQRCGPRKHIGPHDFAWILEALATRHVGSAKHITTAPKTLDFKASLAPARREIARATSPRVVREASGIVGTAALVSNDADSSTGQTTSDRVAGLLVAVRRAAVSGRLDEEMRAIGQEAQVSADTAFKSKDQRSAAFLLSSPLVAELLHAFSGPIQLFYASFRRSMTQRVDQDGARVSPALTIEVVAALVGHGLGTSVDVRALHRDAMRTVVWESSILPRGAAEQASDAMDMRAVTDVLLRCLLVVIGESASLSDRDTELAARLRGTFYEHELELQQANMDPAHSLRAAANKGLRLLFGDPAFGDDALAAETDSRLSRAEKNYGDERTVRWMEAETKLELAFRRTFLHYAILFQNPTSLDWELGAGRTWERLLADFQVKHAVVWLRAADALLQHLDAATRHAIKRNNASPESSLARSKEYFTAIVHAFEANVVCSMGSARGVTRISYHTFKLAFVAIVVAMTGSGVISVPVETANRCAVHLLTANHILEPTAGGVAVPPPKKQSALTPRLTAIPRHFDFGSVEAADVVTQAGLATSATASLDTTIDDSVLALFVGYSEHPSKVRGQRSRSPSEVIFRPMHMIKVLKDAGLASDFLSFADIHRAVASIQLETFLRHTSRGAADASFASSNVAPDADALSLQEFRSVLGLLARCLAVSHCRGDVIEASRLLLRKLAATEPGVLRSRINARLRRGAETR